MGLLDTLLGRTKPVRANLDALFRLPPAAVTLEASGFNLTGRSGICWKPPAGRAVTDVQHEIDELLAMDGGTDTGAGAGPGAGTPASSTGTAAGPVRQAEDTYGFRWLLLDDPSIEDLVSRVHLINSTLTDNGWGPQLLCSVFGLAESGLDQPSADDSPTLGALDMPTRDDVATTAGGETGDGSVDGSGDAALATVEPQTASGPSALYLVYLYKRGTFYAFAPNGKEHRDSEAELRIKAVLGVELPMEADLTRWFPLWDLPVG